MNGKRVLGIIFANIHEESLDSLTATRTMGSVPFCSRYRLIDFPLSNMVNSGVAKIGVVTNANFPISKNATTMCRIAVTVKVRMKSICLFLWRLKTIAIRPPMPPPRTARRKRFFSGIRHPSFMALFLSITIVKYRIRLIIR